MRFVPRGILVLSCILSLIPSFPAQAGRDPARPEPPVPSGAATALAQAGAEGRMLARKDFEGGECGRSERNFQADPGPVLQAAEKHGVARDTPDYALFHTNFVTGYRQAYPLRREECRSRQAAISDADEEEGAPPPEGTSGDVDSLRAPGAE
ncbi:MAG: hypothetical protein IT285_09235 [Bdellovibrionales bacterium]|nr:hypothetical protein [Bdellovibrionales bacterium]